LSKVLRIKQQKAFEKKIAMLKDKLSKIQVANIKDHGIRKLATLAKTKQRYAEDLLASYTLKIENELINK